MQNIKLKCIEQKSIFKISLSYSSLVICKYQPHLLHYPLFYWINNKIIFKVKVTDFPIGKLKLFIKFKLATLNIYIFSWCFMTFSSVIFFRPLIYNILSDF